MAISIDTVYQKVLALANKEQRGYISPQDFNLFADQAQMEIFEQYFYDLNTARKSQGNDAVYADIDNISSVSDLSKLHKTSSVDQTFLRRKRKIIENKNKIIDKTIAI